MSDGYSVSRAMATIELVAFRPASVTQVSRALRIHPRTARRTLNRMVADGWLARTSGNGAVYAPTMRLVALAAQVVERSPLKRLGGPVANELRGRTGATVQIVVPSYRSVVCVLHRHGADPSRPGAFELVPCHACAGGKALLAFRQLWREDVLAAPLERTTDRTIVDPDVLRDELIEVVQRGYAVEDDELERGSAAIAVPVFSPSGEAIAALSLGVLAGALDTDALLPTLRDAAREIGAGLPADLA